MFTRISLQSKVVDPERSVVSNRQFLASLPLHGATKTSRELSIDSLYKFSIRPNHLGMALLLASTSPCRVIVTMQNSLETLTLLDAVSNLHVFHRKLPADEKLNLENTYNVEVRNVAGEIVKYACHHT